MEIKLKAYAYLVASLIIGSFTPALLVLTQGTNPFELFMLAALVSIPFGLLLVARKKKLDSLRALFRDRKKLLYVVIASLLIYVTYEYGIAYAEHFISSSLTTVIFRINPLLMLMFLPIFLRERLSKRQVLALGLAFVGILIGFSGGNFLGIFNNPNAPIILLALFLALGYALASVIIKWQMLDSDLWISASAFVLAAFFMLLFVGTGARFAPLSGTDIGIVIYIGLTNVFSFYMYLYAFKALKTTVVTNIFSISPFLTIVWASLVFGDQFQLYYLAIAGLTLVGVYIQMSDKVGGSYLAKRGSKARNFTIFDMSGAFADTGEVAIAAALRNGARVMAVKLPSRYRNTVERRVREGGHTKVFTGEHPSITNEVGFMKDVMGANPNDMILMKVGSFDEGEAFFADMSDLINHEIPEFPK